ncbi:hypothetical protein C5167_039390 [Papaver somniferum]|uniref:Lysine ketoglutarate reductase trans-splicing related 1 n=1 Tax=Papaver somniferum TaxID=3469 RepID=A0A4Y7IG82_PAPSO|nr:hypothetical protein C5167_039390 [Papaver somniferum]
MTALKSWTWLSKSRNLITNKGSNGLKMKQLPFMGILCAFMLFIVYRTTNYQHHHTKMETRLNPFNAEKGSTDAFSRVNYLPHGIVQARSDLELRPLWFTSSASKIKVSSHQNLLAIPVGIKQKENVNAIVQKFLSGNFTIMLFHYDSNVDGWQDLEWSNKAIHIIAENQTKWWFAKRFLHPDVVSTYDYIFIWDEDLGVANFHPGRYLKIMKAEGLEISQPALDPDSLEIHHKITIRKRSKKFHRRIYDNRGSVRCSDASQGPPCTGWVEGMAPVFSRSAWHCAWHLIQVNLLFTYSQFCPYLCLYLCSASSDQNYLCKAEWSEKNDLVHGWGMDMKLGYCAQGDRTKKVGVIDSEYIVHQGVQTLGGASSRKVKNNVLEEPVQKRRSPEVDVRSEIRRQSTLELQVFKQRWEKAAREDKEWVDPYMRNRKLIPLGR